MPRSRSKSREIPRHTRASADKSFFLSAESSKAPGSWLMPVCKFSGYSHHRQGFADADEQVCDTDPIKSCHDSAVTSHRTASLHISHQQIPYASLIWGTSVLISFVLLLLYFAKKLHHWLVDQYFKFNYHRKPLYNTPTSVPSLNSFT